MLAMTGMFMGFPQRQSDPEGIARAFLTTVDDLSLDVIRQTATRFSRGRVGGHNNAFPPSTAEFYTEADRLRVEYDERQRALKEAARRGQISPPPDPVQVAREDAMRKRVSEGLAALAAELRNDAGEEQARKERWQKQNEEIQAELSERFKANGGNIASSELARLMKEQDKFRDMLAEADLAERHGETE